MAFDQAVYATATPAGMEPVDGPAASGECDLLYRHDRLPMAPAAAGLPALLDRARHFYQWAEDGRWEVINHALVMAAREKEGREPSQTAGVIDSQSAKTTESGGVRGFDAGKKVKGRKRHIVTDTAGHLVGLIVHSAVIHDRDGVPAVLAAIRRLYPWMRHIFADGGYAGDKLRDALSALGCWTVQIIKRSDTAQGFEMLPRRWVVERTFAWLGRCRRLAKDVEATIKSSTAWALIAHIRRLTRSLARA